jgi:hypothetical protein
MDSREVIFLLRPLTDSNEFVDTMLWQGGLSIISQGREVWASGKIELLLQCDRCSHQYLGNNFQPSLDEVCKGKIANAISP